MVYQINHSLPLNPALPTFLHLDFNSAFASFEQQANPLLRGAPLAIIARDTKNSAIIAASYEAKLWGVKTGMRMIEARERCPFLLTRPADPAKYRYLHQKAKNILTNYSPRVIPYSIDEFFLDLRDIPLPDFTKLREDFSTQLGSYLKFSLGLGSNKFLAKLASDQKHKEVFSLTSDNLRSFYQTLTLRDLPGIGSQLEKRLIAHSITTPLAFLQADYAALKSIFRSVSAYDWYLRLRGYEIDDYEAKTSSFGQSYALPTPRSFEACSPIIFKLVHKAAYRLRQAGYQARAGHLSLIYQDYSTYSKSSKLSLSLYSTSDLFSLINSLSPPLSPKPVKKIVLSFTDLTSAKLNQPSLLDSHSLSLTTALDKINSRYGLYSIHQAQMLGSEGDVHDAIAFGK